MIFFTADLHLGHNKIIRYCDRPFENVEEMNRTIIDKWNATVGPQDTVYVLGDLTLQDPLIYLPRLRGRIVLIMGNHDRDRHWREAGYEVHEHLELDIEGAKVLCTHRPVLRQPTQWDKPLEHRLRKSLDTWDMVLCGHVHNLWHRRDSCVNVGVDIHNFAPVADNVLMEAPRLNPGGCR